VFFELYGALLRLCVPDEGNPDLAQKYTELLCEESDFRFFVFRVCPPIIHHLKQSEDDIQLPTKMKEFPLEINHTMVVDILTRHSRDDDEKKKAVILNADVMHEMSTKTRLIDALIEEVKSVWIEQSITLIKNFIAKQEAINARVKPFEKLCPFSYRKFVLEFIQYPFKKNFRAIPLAVDSKSLFSTWLEAAVVNMANSGEEFPAICTQLVTSVHAMRTLRDEACERDKTYKNSLEEISHTLVEQTRRRINKMILKFDTCALSEWIELNNELKLVRVEYNRLFNRGYSYPTDEMIMIMMAFIHEHKHAKTRAYNAELLYSMDQQEWRYDGLKFGDLCTYVEYLDELRSKRMNEYWIATQQRVESLNTQQWIQMVMLVLEDVYANYHAEINLIT